MKSLADCRWSVFACLLLGLSCVNAGAESTVTAPQQIAEQPKALDRQIDQKKKLLEEIPELMHCFGCGMDSAECQRNLGAARTQLEKASKAGNAEALAKAQEALKQAVLREKQLKDWERESTKRFLDGLKRMGLKANADRPVEDLMEITNKIRSDLADLCAKREQLQPSAEH